MVEKALKIDGHDTNLIVFDDKHYKAVYMPPNQKIVSVMLWQLRLIGQKTLT